MLIGRHTNFIGEAFGVNNCTSTKKPRFLEKVRVVDDNCLKA